MDKSLAIAQTIMDTIEPIDATQTEKWTAVQIASLLTTPAQGNSVVPPIDRPDALDRQSDAVAG